MAVTHLWIVARTVLPLFIGLINSAVTSKENMVVFSILDIDTISILAEVDGDSGNSLIATFLGNDVSIEQLD